MAALYKKSVAYHVPVLSALLHFRGGGQGVGSPGEQAAGGGGGYGRWEKKGWEAGSLRWREAGEKIKKASFR